MDRRKFIAALLGTTAAGVYALARLLDMWPRPWTPIFEAKDGVIVKAFDQSGNGNDAWDFSGHPPSLSMVHGDFRTEKNADGSTTYYARKQYGPVLNMKPIAAYSIRPL